MKYLQLTDGRIVSTVEEVLYRYPQLDDGYVRYVCQVRPFVSGGPAAMFYRRRLAFFWTQPYSPRSDSQVRHVVIHEMMHALHRWLEYNGGRIIFDMPHHEIKTISAYAAKNFDLDSEVIAEALALSFQGNSNPAINYLVNLVEKEIERVQAR